MRFFSFSLNVNLTTTQTRKELSTETSKTVNEVETVPYPVLWGSKPVSSLRWERVRLYGTTRRKRRRKKRRKEGKGGGRKRRG